MRILFVVLLLPLLSVGAQAEPVTLRCALNGLLGPHAVALRVDDPRFPLLDDTPQLRLLAGGAHSLLVSKATPDKILASLEQRLPEWPVKITRADIELDRITGDIRVSYTGPTDAYKTPSGVPYTVNLMVGEDSGRCQRVQPVL